MQRGLLIVKLVPHRGINEPKPYVACGVHWSYGDSLQSWLESNASTYLEAIKLVMGGRMSSIQANSDWRDKPLRPARPLYAYERGEFSPAEAYLTADDARAAEEHVTSHLFEDGKWTMFQPDSTDD
jgi:hypothetical protein